MWGENKGVQMNEIEALKDRFEKVYAKLPASEPNQVIYVVPSLFSDNHSLTFTWKQINDMEDCKGKEEALKCLARMELI